MAGTPRTRGALLRGMILSPLLQHMEPCGDAETPRRCDRLRPRQGDGRGMLAHDNQCIQLERSSHGMSSLRGTKKCVLTKVASALPHRRIECAPVTPLLADRGGLKD